MPYELNDEQIAAAGLFRRMNEHRTWTPEDQNAIFVMFGLLLRSALRRTAAPDVELMAERLKAIVGPMWKLSFCREVVQRIHARVDPVDLVEMRVTHET